MATEASDPQFIKSDETLIAIFAFLEEHDGAGVTEIANELDITKSTVHKHLQTMVHHDFVTQQGETYQIGLRFLDYGMYARRQQPVYRITRGRVEELAEETGELVWCQTHENGKCVYLHGAAGSRSVYPPEHVGNRTPMHQLAGGKAMLASMDPETVDGIIDRHGLPPATENTITDRAVLKETLQQIRERGVAFNREEATMDLYAVASAITDPEGVVLGSIGVSGPKHRLRGERFEEELPKLLLGTANELEFNLEHQEFSTDTGFGTGA